LAKQRGIPIEERRELQEGATREETVALMNELGDRAALCTHGDVLEELFGEAGQKGSTRVVELRDGAPVVLAYLPPPA
jgi:Mg2+/Co2+ transporter CorB